MRYPAEVENDDGWTDWIHPLPGYRMACCDCGLVHNMEFDTEDGEVIFRARRNARSTGQVRRWSNQQPHGAEGGHHG
jgi:hypothetical protein